ncbi:MAG TPA: bifunctional adenosylcobinamide kinase/adenosylcobinamide-phosphate guanylyltransferase, partial [Bacteroidales bacterium]|nr:bifunctional adenosylcobinamide kinase/adenosylcobinamide-phosphate guanylyltransferase [Bacteroidales bacterium]
EEEKYISSHDFTGKVVVLDCITLWLTNLFTDNKFVVDETIKQAVEEFEKLTKQECTFIIVSNEIGMGVHADTLSVRKFTEIQGRINQLIASKATDVFLMISGIPIKIK